MVNGAGHQMKKKKVKVKEIIEDGNETETKDEN